MLRLFKVTCKGMKEGHGVAYVVADNAGDAYKKMLESLTDRHLGKPEDRSMDKVELLAEVSNYPSCGVRLYL